MKTHLIKGLGLAAAACALSTVGAAQELKEITIQATRIINTKTVGRDVSTGSPIIDVSLSYGIKVSDLDLASHYGPIQLEKRVRDTALLACQDLGRKYPDSTPSDSECAKAAGDKAMVRANELVAAAKTSAAK
ncbi:MAG: UrcA family protein [Steroidobacteraceae bacterium]|jgi:UrcA family protein